jgi:acetyl-CoA acetyltransferase
MEYPVILSAVRTPIGKFMGGLAPLSAPELGAKVIAEAVRRADIEPKVVDEAIMGNVVQAGLGQNPARQAALRGGLDPRVAAMTINKVCGSGLKSVALAAQAVLLGESEVVVAGGMESMSNCPYLLKGARTGIPPRQSGNFRFHDHRRPVGRVRKLSHGRHRRARRRKIQYFAPGAGSSSRSKAIAKPCARSSPASSARKSCR